MQMTDPESSTELKQCSCLPVLFRLAIGLRSRAMKQTPLKLFHIVTNQILCWKANNSVRYISPYISSYISLFLSVRISVSLYQSVYQSVYIQLTIKFWIHLTIFNSLNRQQKTDLYLSSGKLFFYKSKTQSN